MRFPPNYVFIRAVCGMESFAVEPPTEEQGMCIDQQLMGTMFLDACPTGYNSDDVSPVHSHRHGTHTV